MSMVKLLLHYILSESSELREASLFSPCGFDGWSVLARANREILELSMPLKRPETFLLPYGQSHCQRHAW